MKIEINYDLIEKIQQAKGEAKLQRSFKQALRTDGMTTYIPTVISLNTIFGITGIITPDVAIKNLITLGVLPILIIMAAVPAIEKITYKITGETMEESAKKELNDLSLQLNSQFVKTSVDLLLDSREYHKKHKLILNKKGLPCIMQNKYIMVPTYDDGDIKETSILQEHEIGSKKYVLSLGSPQKAKQFKLAYGTGM